jgi:hypothetical protein
LNSLSRQVSLVWNRKTAAVRPVIAQYARLLPHPADPETRTLSSKPYLGSRA